MLLHVVFTLLRIQWSSQVQKHLMYQSTKEHSAVSLSTHLLYIPTTCITGYVKLCSLVHSMGDAMHPVVRDLAIVRLLIIMIVVIDPSTTKLTFKACLNQCKPAVLSLTNALEIFIPHRGRWSTHTACMSQYG